MRMMERSTTNESVRARDSGTNKESMFQEGDSISFEGRKLFFTDEGSAREQFVLRNIKSEMNESTSSFEIQNLSSESSSIVDETHVETMPTPTSAISEPTTKPKIRWSSPMNDDQHVLEIIRRLARPEPLEIIRGMAGPEPSKQECHAAG